ncbi:WYL domain-containing protein [bacterium]|nr:WYL domain-containing protein [bacterium]
MEEDLGKFRRLLRILHLLSNPGGVTTKRLTKETGVDARTIYRDLNELRDACFDIVQLRPRGPYRLSRDYTELAQTLTLEEVLCLALSSCVFQKQLGGIGREAMRKLFNFVKGEKREKARELPGYLETPEGEEHAWIPSLMMAVSQRRRVRFHYNKGEEPLRTVDPYTLFYQNERWYFQGMDDLRKALRSFRLARIDQLEVLNQHFTMPDAYDSKSALFHKWDIANSPPIPVKCKVDASLAQWLRENPVHPSQRLENQMLHLRVRDLDALAHWLLSLRGLEALDPPQLRHLIQEKASRVAQVHL